MLHGVEAGGSVTYIVGAYGMHYSVEDSKTMKDFLITVKVRGSTVEFGSSM